MHRKSIRLATFLLGTGMFAGVGLGQEMLVDGDFDGLEQGSAPNCNRAAGAWGYPANYADEDLCEPEPDDVIIIGTDTFDPTRSGNSLKMNVLTPAASRSMHLPNVFSRILESPGYRIVSTFEIWVAEPGTSGGSIYLSGDHGGGGFHRSFDRGPQLTWQADGTITYTRKDSTEVILGQVTAGAWQTVRIEIDLVRETWDLFLGPDEGSLAQAGEGLEFRAIENHNLRKIDRFTVCAFGDFATQSRSAIDNVRVYVEEVPPVLLVASNCPQSGLVEISWTDATPDESVAILCNDDTGSQIIPTGYSCAGTELGLAGRGLEVVDVVRSDSTGSGTRRQQAPATFCGAWLQVLDLETCLTSNVARIE